MATLLGSTIDMGDTTWRVMKENVEDGRVTLVLIGADEIVHRIPQKPTAMTPCCGRSVFELSRTDRITIDGFVTCRG